MLFNNTLHNFKKFTTDWNIDDEYVLFGASKECVQFIRSIDYLFGEPKLKIKYIVDHETNGKTNIENINEISEYYRESKEVSNSRKNIKLVDIKDFKGDEKVIITTDAFRNTYKEFLDSINVKHTWYKNIASIWPLMYKDIVHIFQTDVLLTERCNLNCSFCNMFMPHYKHAKDRDLETIKNDIDSYFNKVDYVSVFHLVGGESFLYSNIDSVIEHISSKYSKKIDKFIITTNGTVLPKDSTINLLKKNDVILSISNYSDKLPKLKNKVDRVIKNYEDEKITHYVRNNIEWYDFGDLRESHNMSEEELIHHFDSCTAPFRGLNDGKFYYCHLNTSAVLTGEFESNENDFVYISDVSKEDLIKFDLGFTNLGYITFCDNCNGCNTGIKVPVSYQSQGIRK